MSIATTSPNTQDPNSGWGNHVWRMSHKCDCYHCRLWRAIGDAALKGDSDD